MKKYILILMVALMSVSASASVATTCSTQSITIPESLIVKQTVELKSGRTLTLYYSKAGSQYKIFSTTDLTQLNASNMVNDIKKTSFELCGQVQGKCYFQSNQQNLMKVAEEVYKKFFR